MSIKPFKIQSDVDDMKLSVIEHLAGVQLRRMNWLEENLRGSAMAIIAALLTSIIGAACAAAI